MVVALETAPTFKPGKPETLFRKRFVYRDSQELQTWDIHPDGKRFLMMVYSAGGLTTEENSQPGINIILNWFEELTERVPVN